MAEIVTSPAEQAKWKQLHALAVAVYQAQQRAMAFHRAGNLAMATGQVQTVQVLRGLMATKIAEIQALTREDLSWAQSLLLHLGDWAVGFLQALPGAIAAIPNAILDGLGRIGQKAGEVALKAAFPFGILAVGVIAVLLFAERSRTVRRLAA